MLLTFRQVLQSLPHTSVKRSGVRRTLERQTTLPVVHLPVVERGCGLGVDQVLPEETLQDHLQQARKDNSLLANFVLPFLKEYLKI